MKSFDFSDIEQVNRIELKPGEMVLFRSSEPLTDLDRDQFVRAISNTPLKGRAILFEGDWSIAVVNPGEEE